MVDGLAPGVESIFLGGFVTPQVRAGIGNTYPVIYGTQYKKNDKGQILVDEDPSSASYGMPMPGEPGVLGEVSPDFILGGTNIFSYKNLTLAATMEWKNGGKNVFRFKRIVRPLRFIVKNCRQGIDICF